MKLSTALTMTLLLGSTLIALPSCHAALTTDASQDPYARSNAAFMAATGLKTYSDVAVKLRFHLDNGNIERALVILNALIEHGLFLKPEDQGPVFTLLWYGPANYLKTSNAPQDAKNALTTFAREVLFKYIGDPKISATTTAELCQLLEVFGYAGNGGTADSMRYLAIRKIKASTDPDKLFSIARLHKSMGNIVEAQQFLIESFTNGSGYMSILGLLSQVDAETTLEAFIDQLANYEFPPHELVSLMELLPLEYRDSFADLALQHLQNPIIAEDPWSKVFLAKIYKILGDATMAKTHFLLAAEAAIRNHDDGMFFECTLQLSILGVDITDLLDEKAAEEEVKLRANTHPSAVYSNAYNKLDKHKKDAFITHLGSLGIPTTTPESITMKTIRDAYKKMALTCHPDKTIHLSEVKRAEQEAKMKKISNAMQYFFDLKNFF